MQRFLKVIFSSMLLANSAAANADVITGIHSWDFGYSYYGGRETIGFQFKANHDLHVTALGTYVGLVPHLAASNTVSLWNDAGTLLASVSVNNSDTYDTDFIYAALGSAVDLTAGGAYRMGVGVTSANWKYAVHGVHTDPSITYLQGAFAARSNKFPNILIGSDNVYISANFKADLQAEQQAPELPEPGPVALLGIGLLALGYSRKKGSGR